MKPTVIIPTHECKGIFCKSEQSFFGIELHKAILKSKKIKEFSSSNVIINYVLINYNSEIEKLKYSFNLEKQSLLYLKILEFFYL